MTEKNGKIDFRNPARLEAEKRRKQIAALYLEYKSKAVEGSPEYRIMEAVAHRIGCTQQNVRVQLIKAGVYTPKQRAWTLLIKTFNNMEKKTSLIERTFTVENALCVLAGIIIVGLIFWRG